MKPILFNTEMVRAILEGRKTVTRRVVKPANPFNNYSYYQGSGLWIDGYSSDDEPNGHIKDYSVSSCWLSKKHYIENYAPYKVGDVLYVRETWRWLPCFKCGRDMWAVPCREGKFNHTYKNTGCYVFKADIHNCDADNLKWKPSIHMPKEAARIFLRVTDVRVERLQDITREQIHKEGIPSRIVAENTVMLKMATVTGGVIEQKGLEMCHVDFATLWDSTIKKDQLKYYSWNANPYVWVIEFERVEREEVF